MAIYKINENELEELSIDWHDLEDIYHDFNKYRQSYETQAELIANILRAQPKVHSVKTRVKDARHLIEKVIRKTPERRVKYGEDFKFTVDNYKNEINRLIRYKSYPYI